MVKVVLPGKLDVEIVGGRRDGTFVSVGPGEFELERVVIGHVPWLVIGNRGGKFKKGLSESMWRAYADQNMLELVEN